MATHEIIEYIQNLITEMLAKAGIEVRVEYEDSLVRGLVFNIRSRDAKLLIGYQGTSLYALELLLHALVNRHYADNSKQIKFTIDVDDYKRNREYILKQLVKEAVNEVKATGNSKALPPMSKYERKFIHNYITEQFPYISTMSEGEEPSRRIILSL